MSTRRLFLDEAPGESRGVVTLDGEPEHLLLLRESDPPHLQLGARLRARVRKVEPSLAIAFLDLGDGHEALLSYRPEERPVEGSAIEVEIRTEPRAGKIATARYIGPAKGAPGLLSQPPSLRERLSAFSRDRAVVEGARARQMADQAAAEALATIHPLPGGGSLAIEPTRALVAVDVDVGERKGQDSKRVTRQTNLTAIASAARLLRLKGLGGLVVIDLAGRGHDAVAMLSAARAAFGPDNPGVSISPLSRFGTLELTLPRRTRPVAERLLRTDGAPSGEAVAFDLVRALQTRAEADRGARFTIRAVPEIVTLAEPLVERLKAVMGARFALVPDPQRERAAFDIREAQ